MNELDQLLFTWTARGVNGRRGFQVVAASDGLSSPSSPLAMEVGRLCRYDPPREASDPTRAPVSYGWIDRGHNRIVFRRSYAGQDASGRPGNFVAHIVVGPPALLPVDELLIRFDSTFWWDGTTIQNWPADADFALPRIMLENIQPATSETIAVASPDRFIESEWRGFSPSPPRRGQG